MELTPKHERCETVLGLLKSGDELGVYDMIVRFRVHVSTVYLDMAHLERYQC